MRSGVLIGRAGSRRRLTEALQQALTGTTRMTIVTGVAGIGKTALVTSITPSLPSEAMLGWGTCWEGGAAPGYWPWTQALGALTDAIGLERARSLAADDAGLLELDRAGPRDRRAPRTRAGPTNRCWCCLMPQQGGWRASRRFGRPSSCSTISIGPINHRLNCSISSPGRSTRRQLLIVGTHRPDELDPAARTLLAAVAARGDHITLEGLSASEVRSLIATLAGR